jgi:hypothetical protein
MSDSKKTGVLKDMTKNLPPNLLKDALIVSHEKLVRLNEESAYKSKCPACPKGVLFIQRHPETFELCNLDHCPSCGQHVVYTDATINGEPVRDVLGGKTYTECLDESQARHRKSN